MLPLILGTVALVIPLMSSDSNGSPSGVNSSTANQIECNNITTNAQCVGTINNNYGSTPSSTSPQEQITSLTGAYSDKGFADAIFERNNRVVALYLKSGMPATTLYEGTSAILFGFENVDQNDAPNQSGDPVALIKTFLAGGFTVDTELDDSYLMGQITGGIFPTMFNTNLTPKGYTGGYQDGTFVGSLMFWIIQKSLGWGPSDQDIQAINYLISQGADCKVPLSYLNYSIGTTITKGEAGVNELLSMMQSCAK